MKNWISSIDQLKSYLIAKKIDFRDCHLPEKDLGITFFPMRIPYQYADLIDWTNEQDPLRKMVLPVAEELEVKPFELTDPIGDHDREVVPGLIHRYPDRCLLLLTSYCLIHCRFCFRREVIGKVLPVNFEKIQEYLMDHPEISEVIFSGGDPATFPPAFLDNVRRQLSGISHITRWRFHTRVPAVDPETVTAEWLDVLEKFSGKKIVVMHVNHPNELSPPAVTLVSEFLKRNVLVLSQSVLLKGVNAEAKTLSKLFSRLVEIGVKPYYLHHLDLAQGISHFRISIEEGKNIFTSLRGNLSSICLPEYVVDLPGGFGKVPVLWLERISDKKYKAKTFEDKEIVYTDWAE